MSGSKYIFQHLWNDTAAMGWGLMDQVAEKVRGELYWRLEELDDMVRT